MKKYSRLVGGEKFVVCIHYCHIRRTLETLLMINWE